MDNSTDVTTITTDTNTTDTISNITDSTSDPVTLNYLTTTQYIANYIALEIAIIWYFAFSFRFVSRLCRGFVKKGISGLFEALRKPEQDKSRKRSEPRENENTWQLPSMTVWARMAFCTSFLLFPFFLVTIPQINHDPDYTAEKWFVDSLKMSWFMFVPTFFITVRFPTKYYLDILNDIVFVISLWAPWVLNWLPTTKCYLTTEVFFPISHIIILNLVLYLIHIPSRLHHRLGFLFTALARIDHLMTALIGFFFCFVIVIPVCVAAGFLSPSTPDMDLFDYLATFGFEYFLYSMILELFFRGLIQNLIESHIEKRFHTPNSESKDPFAQLQPFSPLSTMEDDFLTDLDDTLEPAPTTSQKIIDYFTLPWKASVALFVTSLLNGLVFLNVPYKEFKPPNYLYFAFAFLTALAYGWVWRKTTRVTISALTHALVNFSWVTLFGRV